MSNGSAFGITSLQLHNAELIRRRREVEVTLVEYERLSQERRLRAEAQRLEANRRWVDLVNRLFADSSHSLSSLAQEHSPEVLAGELSCPVCHFDGEWGEPWPCRVIEYLEDFKNER